MGRRRSSPRIIFFVKKGGYRDDRGWVVSLWDNKGSDRPMTIANERSMCFLGMLIF